MIAATKIDQKPTLGESPRRLVLYRHHAVEHVGLPRVISGTLGELYARIGQSGVAPAGPPFVIYNNKPEPGGKWEIDVCPPLSARISTAPGFEIMDMPAGRVVSLMHVGTYEHLVVAYDQIAEYMGQNGLAFAGPPREFYFSEPDVPREEVQALIEWPIA